ncbi:MAG: bifunctional [glutamate--ammonia ligase]-adenylyl-L-tyrosine phosphorylase/[glutamate--ammonia-ligase] adenylyltransferase [Kangiellaceae bacterium]|nr:bifunctional [glutamate--ammonia ligase]-adenylyl-L-tyrosine phosphorylase/[glutamate--ammonia-ligase] adenylyltransferase [Kangiellaceae bacterium]
MQTSLSENALLNLDSLDLSIKTSIGTDLFQSLTKTIHISRFVAEVFAERCSPSIEQLQWHDENLAEHFMGALSQQLISKVFCRPIQSLADASVTRMDVKLELQTETNLMSILREIRREHSAAIAVLELSKRITVEQAMERMSVLAEVLIQIAYLWSYAFQKENFGAPVIPFEQESLNTTSTTQQNLLVLAMGKFGGGELNFSSDIDLIFFYLSSGKTEGGRRSIENNRFFQKIGQQLIRLLDEKTADGFVFRVDMRLRPYGDSGNLVMSVDQAEDYYHEQGRGWERFAMVRARVITGRAEEKNQLDAILKPFAFRRYIDYGVIDSLRSMKAMIQREVRRRGLKGNIKLGAGGIREIEFMVQSLQLIQGGRDKRLQQPNVLKVLPLLAQESLLPVSTAEELGNNYRFLRRLEHSLQQLEEKQTQQLPDDQPTQSIICELMGFESWSQFQRALTKIQQSTNDHFNLLFGEENESTEAQEDIYVSLWEGYLSADQLAGQLTDDVSQFSDGEVETFLVKLEEFRGSGAVLSLSQKGAKRLRKFLPSLLKLCLETANPLNTLNNLLQILRSILKRTAYLDLLSENLPVLRHLVDLVSRSDWVVKRLCESPILFDELLYPNSLYVPLQTSDLQSELQQSLLRIDEQDQEQILDTIRSFKQTNELRVAAALLAKRLSISQVNRYLSQLAQVIVQAALNICWREMTGRYGEPRYLAQADSVDINHSRHSIQTGFAIIAYGKLGGGELGFNSDLDLVFLFDQSLDSQTHGILDSRSNANGYKNKISTSRFYTRLAQKLIHFLSTRTSLGVLYEVDMRLRPSGNSGMLVSHIDAFELYQSESAWTWEHQALVRARGIAGDVNLMNTFEQLRQKTITQPRNSAVLKKDVSDMRERMRKELDNSNNQVFNLKQGIGGIVDIEFISQYLVLDTYQGSLAPVSLPNSTVDILRHIRDENVLAAEQSQQLISAFKKYVNCLNNRALESEGNQVGQTEFVEEKMQVKKIWNSLFY